MVNNIYNIKTKKRKHTWKSFITVTTVLILCIEKQIILSPMRWQKKHKLTECGNV